MSALTHLLTENAFSDNYDYEEGMAAVAESDSSRDRRKKKKVRKKEKTRNQRRGSLVAYVRTAAARHAGATTAPAGTGRIKHGSLSHTATAIPTNITPATQGFPAACAYETGNIRGGGHLLFVMSSESNTSHASGCMRQVATPTLNDDIGQQDSGVGLELIKGVRIK